MSLTPFDATAGTKQFRIEPVEFEPTEGSYVFVLGQDGSRDRHFFNVGDYCKIAQTANHFPNKTFQVDIRVRETDFAMPTSPDLRWKLSLLVDSVEQTFQYITRTRLFYRMQANLSALTNANHLFEIKLELVEVL